MRLLALAAAALLVACGVKAPPRPPLREAPDAGASSPEGQPAPHPGPLPAPRGEGAVTPSPSPSTPTPTATPPTP